MDDLSEANIQLTLSSGQHPCHLVQYPSSKLAQVYRFHSAKHVSK